MPFTDPKYTGWYTKLDEYVKAGYVNNDVMSLDLDQGVRAFGQGKGAMTFTTDGMLATAMKDLGEAKVGVMRPPKLGTGTLADAGNATQSISHFVTSWSAHPQEAADFLQFMHTPERLTAWYKATGVVPADDRFDASLVTIPQLQSMAKARDDRTAGLARELDPAADRRRRRPARRADDLLRLGHPGGRRRALGSHRRHVAERAPGRARQLAAAGQVGRRSPGTTTSSPGRDR